MKLVRHMQNPSYTYDKYLICIGLGPSKLSVTCKNPSYSGPSYPSSLVVGFYPQKVKIENSSWKTLRRPLSCRLSNRLNRSPKQAKYGLQKATFFLECVTCLTHQYFRVHLEIVVWIYDTFGNNFEIKIAFTRYFNDSCW